MKSISKKLSERLGGTWKYLPKLCGWYSNDGKRLVRVWFGDDGDNGSTEYWLYRPDKIPERGETYMI